jgi:hypothetical protein
MLDRITASNNGFYGVSAYNASTGSLGVVVTRGIINAILPNVSGNGGNGAMSVQSDAHAGTVMLRNVEVFGQIDLINQGVLFISNVNIVGVVSGPSTTTVVSDGTNRSLVAPVVSGPSTAVWDAF